MDQSPPPGKPVWIGLFLITLATLMNEILLTRIFSVTMWYHFAFMAVSIAMLGMTIGSIAVYIFPGRFTAANAPRHMAASALLAALTMALSFRTHVGIPVTIGGAPLALAASCTALTVPFIFCGVCVSLALTKFPSGIGRLYAIDLAGAATGCIALAVLLEYIDAPSAMLVVAGLAAAGSRCFAMGLRAPRIKAAAVATACCLFLFAGANATLARRQAPLLRPLYVKGRFEGPGLYTKWNAYSRVRIDGDPDKPISPFGWGFSEYLPEGFEIPQLLLSIDATAITPLTRFDGDLSSLEYLDYDITNLVHYLRRDARVTVIGAGGGRDILSALRFGQRSITGIEINKAILNAVHGRFGDFTGHLDRNPRVRLINDEARSFLARDRDPIDILQISLIDTWAATAAGAFVLSENSLYTVEAWKLFIARLSDRGVLSVSRWYFRDRPAEIYRTVALAAQALLESGVSDPRRHILLARAMKGNGPDQPEGVGTILVSRTPFSEADTELAKRICDDLGFDVMVTAAGSAEPMLEGLTSGIGLKAICDEYELNIAPPRDNSPFFFHMLRLRDFLDLEKTRMGWTGTMNLRAVMTLATLLCIVAGLCAICIVLPLWLAADRTALRGSGPLLIFFSGIGLGFMLIEIALMQRLIVFLGHPIYGLTVVLFSLLLSSGAGSWFAPGAARRAALIRLGLLLAMLVVLGCGTPALIAAMEGQATAVRILAAAAVLAPAGFLMGQPFPLGMALAAGRSTELTPWLWGINGAMSVLASVLAVVIALQWGISAAFWTGAACYLAAGGAYLAAVRVNPRS